MLRFVRLFMAALWLMLVSTASLLICFLFYPFINNAPSVIWRTFCLPSPFLFGLNIKLENQHILQDLRSSLIISNHQDTLDVFLGGFIVPDHTVLVGKKQLVLIPLFGQIFWLTGNIALNRANRKKAFESLENAKNAMVGKGKNIWIMPEGTRSRKEGLLPFKKGPFHLAIHAQVPVVPIAFSPYSHLDLNALKSGTVTLCALEPIETKGLTKEDIPSLMERSRNAIKKKLDEWEENGRHRPSSS